ncbi:MAG: IS630 transposase-related protein [candidate division WOR-3 bacterium]
MQPLDKVKIRFDLVKYAKKESITEAAQIFTTGRPTVYKWLKI